MKAVAAAILQNLRIYQKLCRLQMYIKVFNSVDVCYVIMYKIFLGYALQYNILKDTFSDILYY